MILSRGIFLHLLYLRLNFIIQFYWEVYIKHFTSFVDVLSHYTEFAKSLFRSLVMKDLTTAYRPKLIDQCLWNNAYRTVLIEQYRYYYAYRPLVIGQCL